jgi:DNA replication initiation complex subunit (GINS family)
MITYSEFIRIRREEQEDSRTLSKLTNEVLEEMKDYIAINKKSLEEAKKMDDQKRAEEIATQISNAIKTLDQILTARMNKIANMAIQGTRADQAKSNMTSDEIVLFDNISRLVNEHKLRIIKEIKEVAPKEMQKIEAEDDGNKTVIKIIAEVPRFIWRNNKSYGPFGFPNVIEIDKDVAEILIKSGKAVGV